MQGPITQLTPKQSERPPPDPTWNSTGRV